MIRKIIRIQEDQCNGCGLCVSACHEGAIGLVGGKARLLRDDYCDGLGNCLPVCPAGAIAFEEREAAEYDEAAVKANMEQAKPFPCGCPGTRAEALHPGEEMEAPEPLAKVGTHLNQWPVQIKLVPVNAAYFENASLLVSADCAAYAYGNFHCEYMQNRVTVIGCPKLDGVDYSEKLTAIFARNNITSVTVVRMEVPCCAGIENAVRSALQNCGKVIPWQIAILSTDGRIIRQESC